MASGPEQLTPPLTGLLPVKVQLVRQIWTSSWEENQRREATLTEICSSITLIIAHTARATVCRYSRSRRNDWKNESINDAHFEKLFFFSADYPSVSLEGLDFAKRWRIQLPLSVGMPTIYTCTPYIHCRASRRRPTHQLMSTYQLTLDVQRDSSRS